MKTPKTDETKTFGSFQVTPDTRGNRVYFNFAKRGGAACYDLERGEFVPVHGEVGEKAKNWVVKNYIGD